MYLLLYNTEPKASVIKITDDKLTDVEKWQIIGVARDDAEADAMTQAVGAYIVIDTVTGTVVQVFGRLIRKIII